MKSNRWKAAVSLLAAYFLILAGWVPPVLAQQGTNASYVAGERNVAWYNFGLGSVQGAFLANGNTSTGSQTITACPAYRTLPDGRSVNLFGGVAGLAAVPITLDAQSSTNRETVTPTAVSLTGPQTVQGSNQAVPCAQITASFSFTHANSQNTHQVISGDGGLQEAINDAFLAGGGVVTVGADSAGSVTNTILAAAVPYASVTVADKRTAIQYWNDQGGLTTLAAPATLTAVTALPSTSPVGAFTATAYNICIAYVDIAGQEGPCSTSFVDTGAGATSSFIFSAPAASAGAVGYTIYIGLTGAGSTTLQYKVPITSAICRLTTIETTTAACAVTNATYNQTGAVATVTAITVNTSPIQPAVTVVSTTSVFVPNAGGRTTFTYVPGLHVGVSLVPPSFLPFTIAAATATTVPTVIGTVNLPPAFMNIVGRTIEVCGKATSGASTATIGRIRFQWDSFGQNTAGAGVQIGGLELTPVAAFATTAVYTFCEDFQTTVAGASATAGSINTVGGFLNTTGVAAAAGGQGASSDATVGATASLNLASEARLNVIYLHTTGTDTFTLQGLSVKVVN